MKSHKIQQFVYHSKNSSKKKTYRFSFKIFFLILLILFLLGIGVGSVVFYVKIIKDLPDISRIETLNLAQATTITDRNGKVLYKLFSENREYIPYEKISQPFVNAIVAIEDKDFWTNQGLDFIGMSRGLIRTVRSVFSKERGSLQGGSTITQQLVRNILLTRDQTVTRKLKEVILTMQIDDVIENQVKQNNSGIAGEQIKRKKKEKIMELYANYIFFGNNAYGIESASKTYFGKSASEVNNLEAAILASIPKGPSVFEPYRNRAALMGALEIQPNVDSGEIKKEIIRLWKEKVSAMNIQFSKTDEGFVNFAYDMAPVSISYQGNTYNVKYKIGRKDLVLARMYVDNYIDAQQVKQAWIDGVDYDFKKAKVSIVAPHFVFWVISELKKTYDEEFLTKGGLTIKTTLDLDMQLAAEESVAEQRKFIEKYGANNTSMVYVDSKEGDVLAYVGSVDYNNEEIDGKVDMVQAMRQPGSTIKPLIYAMGMRDLGLTLDTPIYDLPMLIDSDTPNNFDGQFFGLMPLRNALAYSRNIPAIKMYFAVGQEKAIKEYMRKLGVNSFADNVNYGYPLAIGGGEIKMIEWAAAYSHLSAMGKPAKINPILEVRLNDGSLVFRKIPQIVEQVLPEGVTYLLWKILSEKGNMPPGWVPGATLPGVLFGVKSGTTDLKTKEGKKLPRDGWRVAYTPSKVSIFWAGNTDGKAMNPNAYGGGLNAGVRKGFMNRLKKLGALKNENIDAVDVSNVSISKISGKLASADTPAELIVGTMGYSKNLPKEVDANVTPIQVDKLCNGLVNDETPFEDIMTAYLFKVDSFIPSKMDLKDIEKWRNNRRNNTSTGGFQGDVGLFDKIFVKEPDLVCTGRVAVVQAENVDINIIKPEAQSTISYKFSVWYGIQSVQNINNVKIMIDETLLGSYSYQSNSIVDIRQFTISDAISPGTHKLVVSITDENGAVQKREQTIKLVSTDNQPPIVMEDRTKVITKENGTYDVSLLFNDELSSVVKGSILQEEKKIFSIDSEYAIFNTTTLEPITYEVIDAYGNKKSGTIDLSQFVSE